MISKVVNDVSIPTGSCNAIFSNIQNSYFVKKKFLQFLNDVSNDLELLKLVIIGDKLWTNKNNVKTKAQQLHQVHSGAPITKYAYAHSISVQCTVMSYCKAKQILCSTICEFQAACIKYANKNMFGFLAKRFNVNFIMTTHQLTLHCYLNFLLKVVVW